MKTLTHLQNTIEHFFYRSLVIVTLMTVMILQLTSFTHAAQTTLAWDPPVNADGTPFTGVSGYKLYVGSTSRSYAQTIDVGNTTTYALNNLSEGSTYYFAVTDYDNSGNESGYSNEVSKSFPFTYSLTATAGAGGTIVPVGTATASTATSGTSTITSMTVSQGGSQSFSIIPSAGYNIANVTVDGISVGAVTGYTFSNVTANHTIAATFASFTASSTFTVTATAGTGGSITPSGIATVNSGASQVYTIAPAAGYRIADVKVDGISVGAVASYNFSNVTANHNIAATFAAITYSVSATAGTGGSITPSGTATVNSGASQTYAIAPASGYSIATVTVDGVSVGAVASYTFSNITANHTIAVSFKAASTTSYTITATAYANGSISPSGSTAVASGGSKTYTITPAAGYQVSAVVVDGVSAGLVTSYTFSNVTANHTIAVSFKVITTTSYTITATAYANGSISPSGSTAVASGGSKTYTITPAAGYRVSAVVVDGVSVGLVTSYTFSNVTANHTIAVSFAPITYSVSATAGTGGSITPSGIATVNSGSSKTYTITPASGYRISAVKVDGVSAGTNSSYTFSNIIANHTIVASFTKNRTR